MNSATSNLHLDRNINDYMQSQDLKGQNFVIPKNGDLFVSRIKERCIDLINSGIWSGITISQFRIWLNNFGDDRELYFAACILDSLVYRSLDQTVALMEQLFQRVLPDLTRDKNLIADRTDAWLELLSESSDVYDPGIRIVPVIRSDDPPTKSGPLLCRMYRQHLGFSDKWMIWPWQIEEARHKGLTTFLFVDDFLGTGTQFSRFAQLFNIKEELKGTVAIYAPLVAHEVGLSKLARDAPWLWVCSVERLSRDYGLFTRESKTFDDGENTSLVARKFYFDILRNRELNVGRRCVAGYGHLALTYVFQHATPNNCIPLLWYANENWNPLFRR